MGQTTFFGPAHARSFPDLAGKQRQTV